MLRLVRSITFILLLLFVCSVLVGCSQKNEKNVEPSFMQEELKHAKLTFYFMYWDNYNKPDIQKVLEKIEAKTKYSLNVDLDFQWFDYMEYINKLRTIISSNDPVDAFIVGEPDYYLFDFTKMAREGMLMDISNIFPKNAPRLYGKYTEDELASARVDGRLYAVPNRFTGTSPGISALVRQDFMKKYNLPEIKTFDDYQTYLKTIKENENGIIPGMVAGTTAELFNKAFDYILLNYDSALVYKRTDPEMKVMALEQTPDFKKGMKYVFDWYKSGYLKEFDLNDTTYMPAAANLISTGKLSSCMSGRAGIENVYQINELLKKSEPDAEIKQYFLYPNNYAQRGSSIGSAWGCGSFAFSANSKNVDRAIMFLDWVQSSQENYDLVNYGIVGTHYILKGDQYAYPDGMEADKNPYIGWPGVGAFKDIEYERIPSTLPSIAKKLQLDYIKEKMKFPPHEGFFIDYSPVINEQRARITAYERIIDQPFKTGILKMEEIDSKIDELKNAGTDKFVTEIQRQLDNWKKNKK